MDFDENTPDFIKESIAIAPSQGSKETEFYLNVKNSNLLDYDDVDGHWWEIVNPGDPPTPKRHEITV